MNTMQYRGYHARIEYDVEDRIFVGHLTGIETIVGFHGVSVDELEIAFHQAVDDYLDLSLRSDEPAEKSYSGNLLTHRSTDP